MGGSFFQRLGRIAPREREPMFLYWRDAKTFLFENLAGVVARMSEAISGTSPVPAYRFAHAGYLLLAV
jgi:hypothetical protein